MPKQKTHRGAAKRFKITGRGKVMRHHAGARHYLGSKTIKRKRNLRKATRVAGKFEKKVREILSS